MHLESDIAQNNSIKTGVIPSKFTSFWNSKVSMIRTLQLRKMCYIHIKGKVLFWIDAKDFKCFYSSLVSNLCTFFRKSHLYDSTYLSVSAKNKYIVFNHFLIQHLQLTSLTFGKGHSKTRPYEMGGSWWDMLKTCRFSFIIVKKFLLKCQQRIGSW